MQIEVLYKPFGALAKVQLEAGEPLRVEAGAMVGMSAHMNIESGVQGGILKGIGRMFAGESFFQNTYTPQGAPGEVLLAPPLPGDVFAMEVPQQGLRVQSTAYIAGHSQVQINTKVGGFKSFFGGEGLFVLDVTATGPGQNVILGSYGGVELVECNGTIVIDTGHLVAWDKSLDFSVGKSSQSGWIASWLSGEGLVCTFRGQGRIWMQSRNAPALGQAIGPKLPAV